MANFALLRCNVFLFILGCHLIVPSWVKCFDLLMKLANLHYMGPDAFDDYWRSAGKQMSKKNQNGVARYDGGLNQRQKIRAALTELNTLDESDQRITDLLQGYIEDDKVPGYAAKTTKGLSRATINRIRLADDEELSAIRRPTIALLYTFLCHCPELKSSLLDETVRVHSAHELAPLLENLQRSMGATDGPLNNQKMKSLEGIYYLYRKAWTSPKSPTYVRCILRFEWVGDALFYFEEQKFFDTVAKLPVNETDQGLVLPFGMNVVLLGKGQKKDLLKFFSFHDFTPYPDGHQHVYSMNGNFIAVYSKGPHPGYRAFAQRIDLEELAGRPETKFYADGELSEEILQHLED